MTRHTQSTRDGRTRRIARCNRRHGGSIGDGDGAGRTDGAGGGEVLFAGRAGGRGAVGVGRGLRGHVVGGVDDEVRAVVCLVREGVVDDFEGVVVAARDVAGRCPGVVAAVGDLLCPEG